MPYLSTEAVTKLLATLSAPVLLVKTDGTVLSTSDSAREWLGPKQIECGAKIQFVKVTAPEASWPLRTRVGSHVVLVDRITLDSETYLLRLYEKVAEQGTATLFPEDELHELRIAFDNSHDEIFVADGAGRLLMINAACTRLYGRKPEELVGRTVADVEQGGIWTPITTPEVLRHKQPVSVLQRTSTGREVLVTSVPVLDSEGQVIRVVGNSRDVTEIIKLYRELENQLTFYRQEVVELRQQLDRSGIIFVSKAMERVLQTSIKVARTDTPVLLLGESGVGKDQLAHSMHRWSGRGKGPFIRINCAAVPEHLLESELFGYDEGAFTGARRQGKAGLFEMAHGGTLFLNELGEMPLTLQPKLLQALETGEIYRLGSTKSRQVDVRLIAATNRNLAAMVEQRQFREDLFYRLNVVTIEIPPLGERPEDIPPLITGFLDQLKAKYGPRRLAGPTATLMLRHHWPGNVRELHNVLERLALLSETSVIPPELLPDPIRHLGEREFKSLSAALEETERVLIQQAYQVYRSTHKVARALGISQPTVVRKLKRYRQAVM